MTIPLAITEEEYDELARQEPELARRFVQAVLGLRGAAQGGAAAWRDPWLPYRTVADAYQERPPTPYLVERLLPLPSLAKIYGPPGTLKSMLLMDLGVCVALGRPWLGGGNLTPFAVQKAPVLWLDLDQGEAIMYQRLGAIGRGLGAGVADCPFYFKSLPAGGFDLNNTVQVGEMARRMGELGARLLCIDNLGVAKGAADENTDRMIPVMYNLRKLAEECEACVVILHHARKENGYKARFGESSRGHTSITAAVDISLGIDRNVQDPEITISIGKVRRRPLPPFGARFHVEHAPGSDDMSKAWFSGLTETEAQKEHFAARQAQCEAIDAAILDALQAGQVNKGSVIEKVQARLPKTGRDKVGLRLEILAAQGKLKVEKGNKNANMYSQG